MNQTKFNRLSCTAIWRLIVGHWFCSGYYLPLSLPIVLYSVAHVISDVYTVYLITKNKLCTYILILQFNWLRLNKWPVFCRQHFQITFHTYKLLHFDLSFTGANELNKSWLTLESLSCLLMALQCYVLRHQVWWCQGRSGPTPQG